MQLVKLVVKPVGLVDCSAAPNRAKPVKLVRKLVVWAAYLAVWHPVWVDKTLKRVSKAGKQVA